MAPSTTIATTVAGTTATTGPDAPTTTTTTAPAIDLDGDGLTDDEEAGLGTDHNDPDSDDDTLSDGDEVNTYGTDPLSIDTDGDELPDAGEVVTYGSDPLDTDTDDDGLLDIEPVNWGTGPTNPDTDDDGLLDGQEVNDFGSDPHATDSDGDSLGDGDEVNTWGSRPDGHRQRRRHVGRWRGSDSARTPIRPTMTATTTAWTTAPRQETEPTPTTPTTRNVARRGVAGRRSRPGLGSPTLPRPPVAPNPRPVGDPRRRSDAPADPGRARRSEVAGRSSTPTRLRRRAPPRRWATSCGIWQGLGYPRRARNLHDAAAIIVRDFGGVVPDDGAALLSLPGVGPYTARAVRVFAFEHDDAVVETNIARLLARITGERLTAKRVQAIADAHVPVGEGLGVESGADGPRGDGVPSCPALCGVPRHGPVRMASRRPPWARPGLRVGGGQHHPAALRRQRPPGTGPRPPVLAGGPAPASEFSSSIVDGLVADRLVIRDQGTLRLP